MDLNDPSDKQLWLDIQSGQALLRIRTEYTIGTNRFCTVQTLGIQKLGNILLTIPKTPQMWT
jgi:hypothetical protein